MSMESYFGAGVLTASGNSTTGQVAAIVGFLDAQGCYIDELKAFDDTANHRCFVRCAFHSAASAASGNISPAKGTDGTDEMKNTEARFARMRHAFMPTAARFNLSWALYDAAQKPKVLIMVSKSEHCLSDLLFRTRIGELPMEIVGIVSNHADLAHIAAQHHLPFHHLPVTPETKQEQEARVLALFEETGAELLVLARYMQILSSQTSQLLRGRAINIHHSFLPGFKGAKPYHQAYERGVKLIGATAHFVTDDLDEGPIIEQLLERVDHTHTPEKLLATGRDVEARTLARALHAYLERRVFINGQRTVVLK